MSGRQSRPHHHSAHRPPGPSTASNERPTERSSSCSSTGSYTCPSNQNRSNMYNLEKGPPEEILVMRHSERLDDLFPGWTYKSVVKDHGKYGPYDLNMASHSQPLSLPVDRPIDRYAQDTPLTVNGIVIAKLLGRGLLMMKKTPDVIYCSPALRCLQTAFAVKQIAKSSTKLRVEPALFENPSLYSGLPDVATRTQREQFDVDESYQPITRLKDLFKKNESVESYNRRLRDVLLRIAATEEKCPRGKKGHTVLVVGHASTVDLAVGTYNLTPRKTTASNLVHIGERIPYCATVLFKRDESNEFVPFPGTLPPLTYRNFTNASQHSFLYRLPGPGEE